MHLITCVDHSVAPHMTLSCHNTSIIPRCLHNTLHLIKECHVPILISKSQIRQNLESFIMPASLTLPHLPEVEAILSDLNELPRSCHFLDIARELRDIIYSDLIASGNVEILQVSQQVHDEAKDLLYRHGICRLHLPRDYLKAFKSSKKPPRSVQNFNVNIDLDQWEYIDEKLSSPPSFRGSGDCHVILLFKSYGNIRMPAQLCDLIKSLSIFRLVTLRIHSTYRLHPMDRRNKLVLEPFHTQNLKSTAAKFSAALGTPEWKIDAYPRNDHEVLAQARLNPYPYAQYLEFHPHELMPRKHNSLEDNSDAGGWNNL